MKVVRDTVPGGTYGLITIVATWQLGSLGCRWQLSPSKPPWPSSNVRKTTSRPFWYEVLARINGSHDLNQASPTDFGQSCMSWHASGVRNE